MNSNQNQSDKERSATVIEITEPQTVQQQIDSDAVMATAAAAATKTNVVIDMTQTFEGQKLKKNEELAKPDRIDDTTTTTIVNNNNNNNSSSNQETKMNGKNHTSNNCNSRQQQLNKQQQQSIGDFGKKKNCTFINRDAVAASAASAAYDEYFIPVNEHRKFMRGEKLYLTMDKRDKKKGFAKYACCFTTFFILSVALVLLVLAGIGIIFQNDIQNEYSLKDAPSAAVVSSRHFDPDVKTGGHSGLFSTDDDNNVDDQQQQQQQQQLQKLEKQPPTTPPSSSIPTTIQPSVSTIQPYTRFEVPNSLEAILRISNLNYVPEFDNKSSNEYKQFAKRLENHIRSSIFDFQTLEYSPATILLRLIDIDPQTFEIKFRIGWMYMDEKSNQTLILNREMLESKLRHLIVSSDIELLPETVSDSIPYEFDSSIVRVYRIENRCELNNNNCTEKCSFQFRVLDFRCECYDDGRELLPGQGCQTLTTTTTTTTTMEPMITTTMMTTVDENEEETDDESFIARTTTTERQSGDVDDTETVTTVTIPFGNDALNYSNPMEDNPMEMGETFASMTTIESINNGSESPTIEMFIVENDMVIMGSTTTPSSKTAAVLNESDFLNEVNNDDYSNRTIEEHLTVSTQTTTIVPSSSSSSSYPSSTTITSPIMATDNETIDETSTFTNDLTTTSETFEGTTLEMVQNEDI